MFYNSIHLFRKDVDKFMTHSATYLVSIQLIQKSRGRSQLDLYSVHGSRCEVNGCLDVWRMEYDKRKDEEGQKSQ
jgi:hypothetical protein